MMIHILAFSVRKSLQFWALEALVLMNLASRLTNVPQRKNGPSA